MPVKLSSKPSFWKNVIKNPVAHRELFSVSSQHYAFVVNAFVSLLKKSDMEKYELFLRETRTLGDYRRRQELP